MNQILRSWSSTLLVFFVFFSATNSWGQTNYISWNFETSNSSANYSSSTTNQLLVRTSALSDFTASSVSLVGANSVNANTFHRSTSWNATLSTSKYIEFTLTLDAGQTFRNETLNFLTTAQVSNTGTAARNYQVAYSWAGSTIYLNATNGLVTNVGTGTSTNNSTIPAPGNTTTNILSIRIFVYGSTGTGNMRLGKMELTGINAPLAPISNLAPTAAPTYSGIMNVTETLTAVSGFVDADGDSEGASTFQWYRADDDSGLNEAAIGGAIESTYTLTVADEGKYIRVGVVPVAATGTSPGVEAFSTRQLVNTRPVASLVSISGVPNVTQTLTGNYTYFDADSDAEGTSLYEWWRADDEFGTNAALIGGEFDITYVLQAADESKYIRFGVLPADDNDSLGEVVYSAWTGPISVAGTPSLTVSEVLTENTLNNQVITLNLVNDTFVDATLSTSNFTLNGTITGLSVASVSYTNTTTAALTLSYDNTDFDTDVTDFSVSIAAAELTSNAILTSTDQSITANIETLNVTGTLAFGSVAIGDTTASQTFTLSGSDLKAGDITLAALNGYEYSLNDTTFTTTLNVANAGGTLAATTIYVRFTPDVAGSFDGSISISGAGASTTQAVTGSGALGIPVATAATNVGTSSFTANWNAVAGATSYEIDVYQTTTNNATNLFISEYGEGNGGNKKYIEIFNGTGASVDLANYEIWNVINGGTWPERVTALSGTLANNTTYVIANNATDVIGADLYFGGATSPVGFNGDDAVGLAWNGGSGTTFTLIDGVGTDGADPGTGWAVAGVSNATVDKILIRKSSVLTPTTDWTASAGTNTTDSEWIVSDFTYNDTTQTTNLGAHTFDSGSISYVFQNENVGDVTSFEVTGLDPDTEYFYVVRAKAGVDETANSNEISATTLGPVTWNGTAWSNITGPTIDLDAIIDGDYTTSGDLSANSLTITGAGSFNISGGDTVTIEGALINNATASDFVVGNNANFIQNSGAANTGEITVTRISAPIKRLDITMWSSPVSGQIIKDLSPATLNNRFLEFDSAGGVGGVGTYVIITDPTTTTMEAAKGYAVRAPNNWSATVASAFTGTFVGTPNNGPYSMSVDASGSRFYLVGNPYPSSLNLNSLYDGGNNHIGSTFHLYEHTVGVGVVGNNFATYNVSGGVYTSADRPTGSIAIQDFQGDVKAGQGFFVEAASGAGTINFTNGMRSSAINNVFLRVNNEIESSNAETFKLNLTTPTTVVSQIALGFFEGATSDLENFDSKAFTTDPLFYSLINLDKMAIQGKAYPMNAGEVFPLGFKAIETGEYTISLSDVTPSLVASQNIFIHDQLTNIYHNLSESDYTFISEAGSFDNRLIIVFTSILSNENPTQTTTQVWVYNRADQWMVSVSNNTTLREITVFDLQGRKLYEVKDLQASQYNVGKVSDTSNILLVKIKTADGVNHTVKTAK